MDFEGWIWLTLDAFIVATAFVYASYMWRQRHKHAVTERPED